MKEQQSTDLGFISLSLSKMVVKRAVKVALLVGTLLALINYGEKIFTATLSSTEFIKILLTYIVPYSVSTWSTVRTLQTTLK